MGFRETLRLSWSNIRNHKLRNSLAVLSVTIGIAAVIAVITMTTGLQSALLNTLTRDLLHADTISVTVKGNEGAFGSAQVFSQRDVKHLETLKGVKAVDVIGRVRAASLYFEGHRLLSPVVQVTTDPKFLPLDAGRPIAGPGEIVIGAGIAQSICEQQEQAAQGAKADAAKIKESCKRATQSKLLADRILGQPLRMKYINAQKKIQQSQLQIVGLIKNAQFLPHQTAYVDPSYHSDTEELGGQAIPVYTALLVKVTNISKLASVKQEIEGYFDRFSSDARKLLGTGTEINVHTLANIVDEIKKNFGQVTGFLGAIAVVALLVGMIGVMNVMLITVKERTREIGIMKATGATNGNVLQLFLTEAVLICLIGAFLGVLAGMGLSVLFIKLTMMLFSGLQSIPFVFVPIWYAIAILTGLVVGVVSGVYPAWSAARTNPIEALRYE